MKTLKQLLANKPRPLAVASPHDTVLHALSIMAEQDVGAVLVMQGEHLLGILSERDYARKIVLHGKRSAETQVQEVMSERVAFVTPAQSIEECMALMTEKHFRHLPVLDAGKVIGVVSIGDLVKEIISDQQFIISELERYISG